MCDVRSALAMAFVASIGLGCEQVADRPETDAGEGAVVRYAEFPPAEAPMWRHDSVPLVSIGVAEGEPEYELSRVSGIVLHRGDYVVADGASGEIRRFDDQGRHLQTVGGTGEGPGEFTQLRWLGRIRGDTLVAWDLRFRRVTIFDAELRLVDTRPLATNDLYVVQGAFEDGDLLLWPFAGSPFRPVPSAQVVQVTDHFAIARSHDPLVLDTILQLPARPQYTTPEPTIIRLPFTTEPSAVPGRSTVWAGNGMTGGVAWFDKRGEKTLEVLLPAGGEVTSQDVEAYLARDLERYQGAERAERARLYREMPMPERLPSYDRVLVDGNGHGWVRLYPRVGDTTQQWVVFDEIGATQGTISFPREFDLRMVQDETALGVWRDEFGVESVRAYRIRGP